MTNDRDLIGAGRAKLQPRLQMVANGSSEVNAVRAETCAALRVTSASTLDEVEPRLAAPETAGTSRAAVKLPPRGRLLEIADDIEANVFVYLNEGVADSSTVRGEVARKANVVSARVRLSALPDLTTEPGIAYVEMAESLKRPSPVVTADKVSAPPVALRRFGRRADHHYGADVLIGIIDVQGFDFSASRLP